MRAPSEKKGGSYDTSQALPKSIPGILLISTTNSRKTTKRINEHESLQYKQHVEGKKLQRECRNNTTGTYLLSPSSLHGNHTQQ